MYNILIIHDRLQRLRNEKKNKEREKREMEANNRRHLANMRVVQKNLVYVIGLSPKISTEETLRQYDYFGQYGKILKIVINRKNMGGFQFAQSRNDPGVGVYVTFVRKDDAARCIQAVDGTVLEGRVLRASFGTTKYCSFYLRGLQCQNPGCMYLHEPGEDADSYTKEDMAMGKHHSKIHPTGTHLSPSTNTIINENGIAVGPAAPLGVSTGSSAAAAAVHGSTPVPTYINDSYAGSSPEDSPVQNVIAVSGQNSFSSSSSALPRSAAWATTATPATETQRRDEKAPMEDGAIECKVFDEICPWSNYDPVRDDPAPVVNTAMLHRHLFLAKQCREYFIQLTNQLYQNNPAATVPLNVSSVFLFDPFREDEQMLSDAQHPSVAHDKSRFGFAHELAERFDQSTKLSADVYR